jgi:hypothetical protein
MRYLNRRELAAYCNERGLKITPAMFAKLAHFGGGPEYQLWGNQTVSTPEQADEFIARRLKSPRKSTSEAPRAGSSIGEAA